MRFGCIGETKEERRVFRFNYGLYGVLFQHFPKWQRENKQTNKQTNKRMCRSQQRKEEKREKEKRTERASVCARPLARSHALVFTNAAHVVQGDGLKGDKRNKMQFNLSYVLYLRQIGRVNTHELVINRQVSTSLCSKTGADSILNIYLINKWPDE